MQKTALSARKILLLLVTLGACASSKMSFEEAVHLCGQPSIHNRAHPLAREPQAGNPGRYVECMIDAGHPQAVINDRSHCGVSGLSCRPPRSRY